MLGGIASGLDQLASKGPQVQSALVTTAVALTDAEKEQFQTKLAAQYGDNLALEFALDKEILGGVIVQVGDKIMDGSVRSKLNAAQENLRAV